MYAAGTQGYLKLESSSGHHILRPLSLPKTTSGLKTTDLLHSDCTIRTIEFCRGILCCRALSAALSCPTDQTCPNAGKVWQDWGGGGVHLFRNQSGILKVRGLLTITISCSSSWAVSSPALCTRMGNTGVRHKEGSLSQRSATASSFP